MTTRDWIFAPQPDLDLSDIDFSEEARAERAADHARFIEILRGHFGKFGFDDEDLEWVAHFISFDAAESLDVFWSKKQVLGDIAKIRARLTEAHRLMNGLPMAVNDAIRHGAARQSGLFDENGKRVEEVHASGIKLEETTPWQAFVVSDQFFLRLKDFLVLLDYAEIEAEKGVNAGKKAVQAWRLVHACVDICDKNPSTIRVPKRMNDSGPFYRFLRDVFEEYGQEEDPSSIFNSYSKFMGR